MLKFGWSEVDITPTQKIALAGEFFERVTNIVETPLKVTALAIESDGDQAVLCSCDVVKICQTLLNYSRRKIKADGLDVRKVIISSPHIHNSYTIPNPEDTFNSTVEKVYLEKFIPKGCEYIPEAGDPDPMQPMDILEFVSEKIAEAVNEAWNNRKTGCFANGFGRAAVGMNRRVCYADKTAKMWGDVDNATFTELEGGNDSGIEMMFTYDENKKLTGVIANIACPAQVMEQRSVISSDYWGKVKILLREKYGEGINLMPLCAPAGDQCPRDLVRWVEPETPIKDPNVIRENPKVRRADPSMFDVKGTWTIGRRIMNEVEYALEEVTEYKAEAKLVHLVHALPLPLRRVTETDKREAEKYIMEFFKGKTKVNYLDSADLYVYAGILRRYDEQKVNNMVDTEVHVLRMDDVVFASNPFELFLDYGNQIRARSVAKQTFLIQLCNGDLGYLPTERAEKNGHYSAYVASGYVGHEGGDLLVRDTLTEIGKVFCDN